MSMSEETKKRVKKTLGLCDEYFEAIKDSFNDDGNFLWDKDLEKPNRVKKINKKQYTLKHDNV
jgi:hypothetical protein